MSKVKFCPKCFEGMLECEKVCSECGTPLLNSDAVTQVAATFSQVGGDHYKKMGAYQPWEVLAKWMTTEELKGFAKGTAIAYLAREDSKGKKQDIEKAMHTLQLYLEISGRGDQ